MKNKIPEKEADFNKNTFFYPLLITIIWLVTYFICTLVWEQKLGWDEVAYMSVAKGIATDFDFSARAYTIMGLLKTGYPSSLINYPFFPLYLALFFKVFGTSLQVAYFSTWIAALGVCLLIYFIFSQINDSKKTGFVLSLFYLFYPGILKNCDSALMEQFGCLLLSIFVFLIIKDIKKNTFNHWTLIKFVISLLVLWIYKSLFIGYFFGVFVLMLFAYAYSSEHKKIVFKIPFPIFLVISYGLFVISFYLIQKYLFLPVAPMMSFTHEKDINQTYANFLGGFFDNFPQSLFSNIEGFFHSIVSNYFIYPTPYTAHKTIFNFTPYIVYVGFYFLLFFIAIISLSIVWKKLSLEAKSFSLFVISTILSFNIVFSCLFITTFENIWRYNIYYLPLYLCFLGLVIENLLDMAKESIHKYKYAFCLIVGLLFVFIYIPISLSISKIQTLFADEYHFLAKTNTDIIRAIIRDSKPKFVYFNEGTHSGWTLYPLKQIFKDATNEQILQVNRVLPEPIEYLILSPKDWLFQINKEQILKSAPIINNQYKIAGFNNEYQLVVYQLVKE